MNLWKWTFDDEPPIWTFDLTSLIWWTLIWTLAMMNPLLLWTLWYGPLIWTLIMNLAICDPLTWTFAMHLDYEPLILVLWFDFDFAICFALDPSVLYPSIFLAMKVTWPWHWCTNVMTPVWSSDVPHRPFVWSAFGLGRGVWMHPRFDLICYYIWFGVWYCVQYMPFTYIWELATPWLLEDSPPTTFGILRSPLWIHGYYAEDFDFALICLACGRILIQS